MKTHWNKLSGIMLSLVISLSILAALSGTTSGSYADATYGYLEGVLHSDSYVLYPYEDKSLSIGFSKYGELINPDTNPGAPVVPVGLHYDHLDPFANPNVTKEEWSQGWLLNATYDYRGMVRNLWAFALFSDFTVAGGDWQNNAVSPWGTPYGGRKTNGNAVSQPLQILYDGPRKVVALSNTTLWDDSVVTSDPKGLALIRVYITFIFDKVKKYVLLIKDIKLIPETKLFEKMQVKFGERGEWDIGWKPAPWAPRSYAHFFYDLDTKYSKHPWYVDTDDGLMMDVDYDMCQMIDQDEDYAAFVAYWPELMSSRVDNIADMTDEERLTDLSDFWYSWTAPAATKNYTATVPGYYAHWAQDTETVNSYSYEGLRYPDCSFPGEWSVPVPELWINGVKKAWGTDWYWGDWDFGEPAQHGLPATSGTINVYLKSAPSEDAKIVMHTKLSAEQDDMKNEPRTPYVMGEWVFDLSYDDLDLPTTQFRVATVYGITDLNDGEDKDMTVPYTDGENIIDSEVMFLLDEVFNPWDLRQAMGQWSWNEEYYCPYDGDQGEERDAWPGKWTERWYEEFTGDEETDTFWLPEQIVVPANNTDNPFFEEMGWSELFPDWNSYCTAREKVLVDGELQVPGDDYEILWEYNMTETLDEGKVEIESGDEYQLMYPRIYDVFNVSEIVTSTEAIVYNPTYVVDYADGKIRLTEDFTVESGHSLVAHYYTVFPATYIEFYEDSIPGEDAEIEVFYSTFRIVYKLDKFIAGIDGLWVEESEGDVFNDPSVAGAFVLRYGPVVPYWMDELRYEGVYPNWITVLHDGQVTREWEFIKGEEFGASWSVILFNYGVLQPGCVVEVIYPIFAGRWEWGVVGRQSAPVDSAALEMVGEGLRQWKNHDVKITALDMKDTVYGPTEPFICTITDGTGVNSNDYRDSHMAETISSPAGRIHLKSNWCTTLPISSSNIISVGGGEINLVTEYFNDFTDTYVPRMGTTWGTGFYSPGCWGRNYYVGPGYAAISTYKDLNGTIGLIIQGYTGEDTYWACYALQHGLLKIMQLLQPGVTSIVLEFNYDVKPTDPCFFHIVECVGTITECTGFDEVMEDVLYEYPTATGEWLYKISMNAYSSEYVLSHFWIDFTVPYEWDLPYIYEIEIIMPQYIMFHWEPHVHPDP